MSSQVAAINASTQYYLQSAAFSDSIVAADPNLELTLTSLSAAKPGNLTFLFFRFDIAQNTSEWNICTYSISPEFYCMDEWGNKPTQPVLQNAGSYLGQQWVLTASSAGSKWDKWMLSSSLSNNSRYLTAIGAGNQLLTMEENGSTDKTEFRLIDSVAHTAVSYSDSSSTSISNSNSSPPTPIFDPSYSTPSTPPLQSSLPEPMPDASPSYEGLSKGTSIAVAMVILVVLFILGTCFLIWRRRRSRLLARVKEPEKKRPTPGDMSTASHEDSDTDVESVSFSATRLYSENRTQNLFDSPRRTKSDHYKVADDANSISRNSLLSTLEYWDQFDRTFRVSKAI